MRQVPRGVLLDVLERLGCGVTMLLAVVAVYRCANSVSGTTLISVAIDVLQGSPTSCILFVIVVNDLIRLIKENCDMDGFLAWLHVLVLMDDTVLLFTNRRNMIEKIRLLNQFCVSHQMKINESKLIFFVINGADRDKESLQVDDVNVRACHRYVYLGSHFAADGSVSTASNYTRRIRCVAPSSLCYS